MNSPLAPLVRSLSRALRESVLPELQSDHARTQLAGVLDILAKLESMSDWLSAMRDEEEAALRQGIDAIAARARQARVDAPPEGSHGTQALASAQQHARDIADWLLDSELAPELGAELDGMLRASLRQAVLAQRRRIPRTDFSSMTASSD
jgi:hypothetical protein